MFDITNFEIVWTGVTSSLTASAPRKQNFLRLQDRGLLPVAPD